MRFLRVLNICLVGFCWTIVTILVTIVGGLFFIAVWEAVRPVHPDEQLRQLYVNRDYMRIEELARQENTGAEYWMGVIRQQQQQPDQAKEWYLRAATKQDSRAIGQLAEMYWQENDLEESVRWVRRGAELGHFHMQVRLAQVYRDGRGVPRDEREAFRWFHAAAKQVDGHSSFVVSEMYAKGEGTGRDPVEALAWVTISQNLLIKSDAHTAIDTVCELRDELMKKLSPRQIELAIRRAHELQPNVMQAGIGRETCNHRNER